jgi:hypothetical protein
MMQGQHRGKSSNAASPVKHSRGSPFLGEGSSEKVLEPHSTNVGCCWCSAVPDQKGISRKYRTNTGNNGRNDICGCKLAKVLIALSDKLANVVNGGATEQLLERLPGRGWLWDARRGVKQRQITTKGKGRVRKSTVEHHRYPVPNRRHDRASKEPVG